MNERLVNTFCEMVKIDSESGNEERFISYVKEMLQDELDADCSIDGHGNLIARIPAKDSVDAEPIFLGAHADTVKPGVGIEPVVDDLGRDRIAVDSRTLAGDNFRVPYNRNDSVRISHNRTGKVILNFTIPNPGMPDYL